MISENKILPVHKRFNLNFSHGIGSHLFNHDGNSYLDFGAGIAVNALGHCHPNLVSAIINQAQKLWHVSNIYSTDQLNNYANNLVNASSFADYVFFCNSGAESIECAIKMTRRYFYVKNSPRYRIITFTGAFHGRTIATISAASKPKYLEGFTPALPGFDNVTFNDIEAVKNSISNETAGILIEPIQGEEGIRVASQIFLQQLRQLCDKHQILLIFDEVQCGMGRTGYLFASNYFGVKPDIISTAKGIGGGFPLGACLATKNASLGMTYGVHGTTYGGNPLAMSVANALLNTILAEGFLQQVRQISQELQALLLSLQQKYPAIIAEVRGIGLMLGLKINTCLSNNLVVEKFIEHNLLTIPAGENVIRILPPLIINRCDLEEFYHKADSAFNDIV
jgi:acetylornithine/N-succinyldiaminopimelate aminotransferase